MKNLFKILYHITILLIINCNFSKGDDSTFVTPSELEEGWGFYWTNELWMEPPVPFTYIFFFQVSPDNKWLFWEDREGFNLMKLETREVEIIERFTTGAFWLPNSEELLYGNGLDTLWQIIFYNVYTKNRDTLKCPNNQYCDLGGLVAPDGNSYFAYPNGRPAKDSVIYRVLTDSSRKIGFPVYEKYVEGYTLLPWPLFPPNTMDYFLDDYPSAYYEIKRGFDVIRNLDYGNRSKIRFEPPDTSWVFDACNTNGSIKDAIKPIEVGPLGDVYLLFSFRAKKEIETRCNPKYWDSSTIAARNASGWYRVDTSGQNLVQLVRSWTYGMGGISITADGNTIYYGMLEKDTNASIWRMDRFGRNKEMVVKLSPITSVEEKWQYNNDAMLIFPNPATERLTIKFGVRSFELGVGEVAVYDVFGERILKEIPLNPPFVKGEMEVDVSGLAAGVYYVVVNAGGERIVSQFAVVR